MLVVAVAGKAGDPRAKISPSPVSPYSFAQMEGMIEERMKKESDERTKSIADSRAARVNKNPEFVRKSQDSNVKRSAFKYWRRTYVPKHQTSRHSTNTKDTWNEIVEHAARIIQREKEAWEQGLGRGQGRARGRGRGKGRDDRERQPRWQEGGSPAPGSGTRGGWNNWEWQGANHSGWHDYSQEKSFTGEWKGWSKSSKTNANSKNTNRNIPKGPTAQPNGITAKLSGAQKSQTLAP